MSKGTGPLSKLYNAIIGTVDNFVPKSLEPLWLAPAGPQTIFFWAPLFKWGLVIAGLGDLWNRPASSISIRQCGVIATTGLIWSRYSVVIIPKNYNLCAVNVFVFLTQGYLVYRGFMYHREHAKDAVYDLTEDDPHRRYDIPWIVYFS